MENKLAAAEVSRAGRTTYTDTNHPAVITGINYGSVTEDVDPDADNLLEVSRKLKITDSDAGEAAFIAKIVKGNYGRLRINPDGNWTYVANNNQAVIQKLASGAKLTDSLVVNSVDGTPKTIVIKIKGIDEANSPALISGIYRASLTEDVDPDADNLLEVSRKLKITDSDAGEAAFITKIVKGNYGRLRINPDGNWTYVADNNQAVIQKLASGAKLTDRLVVNSVDGTPKTIVIKIKGIDEANNPALITGFNRGRVTEDVDPDADNLLEVSRKLNITDSDSGEAAFIAKIIKGNYGRLRINPDGNWTYVANNNQAVIQKLASGAKLTDSLVVNSVDGTTHTVKITILGADEINTPADITLSWIAPAEREDNSALSLSAIAGYHIYYGTTLGQYTNSVTINDGSAVTYTFTGLPADTYYFVVTTIDTKGRESLYSPEVKITI
jgi:VCBS repeat-containing protein